jgi:hypothetical protein
LTHSPEAVIHSPAEIVAAWPTIVVRSRLRPLLWFGLLEHREDEKDPGHFERRHLYRKTALFDRFLSFDVTPRTQEDHDTDRIATLPTDRIPTAAHPRCEHMT